MLFSFLAGVKYCNTVKDQSSWMFETTEEIALPNSQEQYRQNILTEEEQEKSKNKSQKISEEIQKDVLSQESQQENSQKSLSNEPNPDNIENTNTPN